MNRIIDQKLDENESTQIKNAVAEWDQQANEDYLRRLELAWDRLGQLVPAARARAPEAAARVGPPKS